MAREVIATGIGGVCCRIQVRCDPLYIGAALGDKKKDYL